MNRRDFLRLIGLAPFAPHLDKLTALLPVKPKPPATDGVLTDEMMQRGIGQLKANYEGRRAHWPEEIDGWIPQKYVMQLLSAFENDRQLPR